MTRRDVVEVLLAVVLGSAIGWLGLAVSLHLTLHHLIGA